VPTLTVLLSGDARNKGKRRKKLEKRGKKTRRAEKGT
jgi:hypothetical protein